MLKEKRFEKYSSLCYICGIALIVLTLVLFCFQYFFVSYEDAPKYTYSDTAVYDVTLDGEELATSKITKINYAGEYLVAGKESEGTSCSDYDTATKSYEVNAYEAATGKIVRFTVEFDEEHTGTNVGAKKFYVLTMYPNSTVIDFSGFSMILNETVNFRVAGFLTLIILCLEFIILLSMVLGVVSNEKESTLKSLISMNVFMILVIVLSFILMTFLYTKLEYNYSGRGLGYGGRFNFESLDIYKEGSVKYYMTAAPIVGFFVSVASYIAFRIFAKKGNYKV